MPANKMRQVDLSGWSRRNLANTPANEIAVRPGMRALMPIASVRAGFTVRDNLTGSVYHYVFRYNNGIIAEVYDEFFVKFHDFAWSGGDMLTGVVTYAVVNGTIIIASPGLNPLRGAVGGPLRKAKKRSNSINPDLSTQPLPRGIVTGWANRCVYAHGNTLYFSDAGDPLSIVSTNVVDPPGEFIYGLHENSNGALMVVTTGGTYELSREAAARGQTVLGVIRKVCNYIAPGYGCSVESRGRTWGVTRSGIRLIDTPDPFDVLVAEPRVRATSFPAVSYDNLQLSKLYQTDSGIIMSVDGAELACVFDDSTQTFSWWSSDVYTGFDVVGSLYDYDGSPIILTSGGALAIAGNYDTGDAVVVGSFVGRIQTVPGQSLTMRYVEIASDTDESVYCAVGGVAETEAVPQVGIVDGMYSSGNGIWNEAPVRSRVFRVSERTDDHSVEFGATGPGSRIDPVASVIMAGVEKARVTN